MIEREERERRNTELVVVRVVCDRCGAELRHTIGSGQRLERAYEGAFVRGTLYPTHNLADAQPIEFDLCADCTRLLREWASPTRDD